MARQPLLLSHEKSKGILFFEVTRRLPACADFGDLDYLLVTAKNRPTENGRATEKRSRNGRSPGQRFVEALDQQEEAHQSYCPPRHSRARLTRVTRVLISSMIPCFI